MSRTKKEMPPSYHLHSGGHAVVIVRTTSGTRCDIPLGVWDPGESKAEYAHFLGVLSAHGGRYPDPQQAVPPAGLSVSEVILAFWKHAEARYS